MINIRAKSRPGTRPAVAAALWMFCGISFATTPAAVCDGPPGNTELDTKRTGGDAVTLGRLARVHELRLARGESAGTLAVLRALEKLQPPPGSAVAPHAATPHLARYGLLPVEALMAGDAARVRETILETQLARVVGQLAGGPSSFCECYCDEACSNDRFCDGTEYCDPAFACASGEPPLCEETDECTIGWCNESSDQCDLEAVPPPAEVLGLALTRTDPALPVATLEWTAVSGAETYSVYRGERMDLADLGCFITGVTATSVEDDGVLPSDALAVYLVTSNHCGESVLGSDSEGAPRVASGPCS